MILHLNDLLARTINTINQFLRVQISDESAKTNIFCREENLKSLKFPDLIFLFLYFHKV